MKKVTHTRKASDKSILAIGNKSENWIISKEDAVREIQSSGGNRNSPFYVESREGRVPVQALPNNYPSYLKTVRDGKETNNLSELPEW